MGVAFRVFHVGINPPRLVAAMNGQLGPMMGLMPTSFALT
jgi:hypothetical protein